jgi:hypothetical protein
MIVAILWCVMGEAKKAPGQERWPAPGEEPGGW